MPKHSAVEDPDLTSQDPASTEAPAPQADAGDARGASALDAITEGAPEAGTQAQSWSVREALKSLGLQGVDQFDSDDKAFAAFADYTTRLAEQQRLLQEQLEYYQRIAAEAAEAAASRPQKVEPEKPQKPLYDPLPEFNPRWLALYDAAQQRWTDPAIEQKYRSYQEALEDRVRTFANDPASFLQPLAEQIRTAALEQARAEMSRELAQLRRELQVGQLLDQHRKDWFEEDGRPKPWFRTVAQVMQYIPADAIPDANRQALITYLSELHRAAYEHGGLAGTGAVPAVPAAAVAGNSNAALAARAPQRGGAADIGTDDRTARKRGKKLSPEERYAQAIADIPAEQREATLSFDHAQRVFSSRQW